VFHNRPDNTRNLSKRYLAMEIEVAAMDTDYVSRVVRRWKGAIVEDGSLPDTGFEINTAPANGDAFLMQIEEICAALDKGDASVNKDCGLHVHVDARDLDHYQIRRLIRLYAKVEDALYDMASPSRRTSQYCKPCGVKYKQAIESKVVHRSLTRLRPLLDGAVYGENHGNLEQRKRNKYDHARYNALNLHSWFYRGTIECRIFNGTVNAEKIKNWGMLWARIVDYAATASDMDVHRLPTDSLACLRAVAGDDLRAFIAQRVDKFAAAHSSVA
jgi:hypothetical protein